MVRFIKLGRKEAGVIKTESSHERNSRIPTIRVSGFKIPSMRVIDELNY